VHFLSIVRYI